MQDERIGRAFDIFHEGFMAFWQAGFLLGALVCFLIGVAILWGTLSRRASGIRVMGEITGVRKKGSTYHAVYRYIMPDGQVVEATASEGSSSLGKMKTGQVVPVIVAKDNPEDVVRAGGILWEVIGTIFAAIGIGFAALAVNAAGTPGVLTWIILAMFFLGIAQKFRKFIIPKDQRLSLSDWRAKKRAERRAEDESYDLESVEAARGEGPAFAPQEIPPSFSPEDAAPSFKTARAGPGWLGPFLLTLSLGFIIGAYHTGQGIARLEAEGLRVPGVVTELDGSGDTYYPVVEFTRADGRRGKFRSTVGTNPPAYDKGEKVTVLYLPQESDEEARIDRGLWNWLLPGVLAALGLALLVPGARKLAAAGPGDKAL